MLESSFVVIFAVYVWEQQRQQQLRAWHGARAGAAWRLGTVVCPPAMPAVHILPVGARNRLVKPLHLSTPSFFLRFVSVFSSFYLSSCEEGRHPACPACWLYLDLNALAWRARGTQWLPRLPRVRHKETERTEKMEGAKTRRRRRRRRMEKNYEEGEEEWRRKKKKNGEELRRRSRSKKQKTNVEEKKKNENKKSKNEEGKVVDAFAKLFSCSLGWILPCFGRV